MAVQENMTIWYCVQFAQLILLYKHVSAFLRDDGLRYRLLNGPGEAVTVFLLVLVAKSLVGLDWLIKTYEVTWHAAVAAFKVATVDYITQLEAYCSRQTERFDSKSPLHAWVDCSGFKLSLKAVDDPLYGAQVCRNLFLLIVLFMLLRFLTFPGKHRYSKYYLICCLAIRVTPALGIFMEG